MAQLVFGKPLVLMGCFPKQATWQLASPVKMTREREQKYQCFHSLLQDTINSASFYFLDINTKSRPLQGKSIKELDDTVLKSSLLLSHFSVSDSVRPHRRQPTRLPRPWDSPGKNTGVGCHFPSPLHESEK